MTELNNKSEPESSAAASTEKGPANTAFDGSHSFEEFRRKLVAQMSELGNHLDGLQHILSDAAVQARSVVEKELTTLKAQYPDTFARIEELRATSDAGLEGLRGRLTKLTGELEHTVSHLLSALAEQAKKATKPHGGAEPGATPPQTAPATETDSSKDEKP